MIAKRKLLLFESGRGNLRQSWIQIEERRKTFTLTKEFLITGGEGRKFSHLFFHDTTKKAGNPVVSRKRGEREFIIFSPHPNLILHFSEIGCWWE